MRRIDGWRKIAGVLSEHAAVGAHALGLTIPQSLLLREDQVIE